MNPADLVFYPPLCLAVCLVWAGTRESTAAAIVRHTLVLGAKLTAGLAILGIALQGLLGLLR